MDDLSRHFFHIRGISGSKNLERFSKLMANINIFFSKKKKKSDQHSIQNLLTNLRAQESKKFQILTESAVL